MLKLEEERLSILKNASDARARDVMQYQINIDNYRLAIAEINTTHSGDAEMRVFKNQLDQLLSSSLVEQKKEQIMLDVITRQLVGTAA